MRLQSERPAWRVVSCGAVVWVDIENPDPEDVSVLGAQFPFHPLNLEDFLSKRQLDRAEGHDAYVFVLLHFPSVGEEGRIVKNQVSMFVGKDYVVSLHGSGLALVRDTAERLKLDERLRAEVMASSTYLAYTIVDKLVDGIFPLLDDIKDALDDIEDEVFDESVSSGPTIHRLRREIADLRRTVFPLKRTLNDAWTHLGKYALKDLSAYFADVVEHVEKAWETLEETKETIEIYKDTDFIQSTDKTNRVLSILTIIFTLSIPAAVLGGIYGMNVTLPGGLGQNPSIAFGPYTSFVLLVSVMVISALLMFLYFRRRGWI